jgi:hypothetical protein
LVLAMALLSVPVLAQGITGNGGVDILGKDCGIFETEESAFKFPEMQDTNIDSLTVGNDRALAFGNIWQKTPVAIATNNLEIKKNQDSGKCCRIRGSPQYKGKPICQDCCIKVNLEQVNVGNRDATAFGYASAANNIKIATNQQYAPQVDVPSDYLPCV